MEIIILYAPPIIYECPSTSNRGFCFIVPVLDTVAILKKSVLLQNQSEDIFLSFLINWIQLRTLINFRDLILCVIISVQAIAIISLA